MPCFFTFWAYLNEPPDQHGHTEAFACRGEPSNKRMQLTKLRAAPVLQAEVPPCAPAGETDGGTASQLIRSVGRTLKCPAWRSKGRSVR